MNRAKHILIVDDSCDNQFLLKTMLEAKGYTTESTPNGKEALTLLNSSDELPQTILLDLRMPIMDGLTFRRLQKDNPKLREIPVIVMSGENDLVEIGIKIDTEVITKPLNFPLLFKAIEKH